MTYVALALFIILNFMDLAITTIAIHYLGFDIEGNPLLRNAMVSASSVWPMFAAKAANTSFVLCTLYASKDYPRGLTLMTWALFCVSAILAVAVVLGILVLKDI